MIFSEKYIDIVIENIEENIKACKRDKEKCDNEGDIEGSLIYAAMLIAYEDVLIQLK